MPTDPRVDRYISDAPAFAQSILQHLRELVHQGCPEVEETIKWSRPIFVLNKKIVFGMAAFKAHCGFGFWVSGVNKLVTKDGLKPKDSSGWLGRITQLADLPPKQTLLHYIQESRRFVLEAPAGASSRPRKAVAKPASEVPADLAAAMNKHAVAAKAFHSFSPSRRREYIEWIVEAKRDETRQKRIATTIEWLAEGKSRNWKYQNC